MKKRFFRWGLQQRIIASVMAVFCIPILALYIYILNTLSQKLYDNALSSANTLLDNVEHGLTEPLESALDTVSFIAADNELYTFLSRPQADANIVNYFIKRLSPEVTQLYLQYPAMCACRFLHRNSSLFPIQNILYQVDDLSAVTSQMQENSNRTSIKSVHFSTSGRSWGKNEKNIWYVDSLIPAVPYAVPAGVIEFGLDQEILWENATQSVSESGMHVFLLNNGNLISATDDTFANPDFEMFGEGIYHIRNCTLVLRKVNTLNMMLCCAIPSSVTSLPMSRMIIVFLALLSIIILTWLLVNFSCRRQLSSLNALTARIDAISPNGIPLSAHEPADEVDRLSQHFDNMYERLKESFYREKNLLYDDLTNQLKPHFICNALNMLQLQAQHFHQEELADSILQINQYFRYSMLDSGATVSLAEETDNALNYMKLVNVMREDKILFDLNMDDWVETHASTTTIPKMLLQPLLENSVRHGIKNKKNAYISIQITYLDKHLQIRITDNGFGMDEITLQKTNELLSNEEDMDDNSHVGLTNVIRRLKLVYPNAYSISMESVPCLGTTVTLNLWIEGKTTENSS